MTPVRFTTSLLVAIVAVLAAADAAPRAGIIAARSSGAARGARESDRARRGVHRFFQRAGATHRRRRLAVPPGRQSPLPHRHERAGHHARPAAGRARAARGLIFSRDRDPAERSDGPAHPVEGTGDGRDRHPRSGFAAALHAVRRRAVPGTRLGRAVAEQLLRAPGMPAFLASVRAGRAEVWLVMHDRAARRPR